MADAFFLSEDDRQILMEIIHQAKQQKKNTTGRPVIPRDDHQAPELYLGKAGSGGITAAVGDILGEGAFEPHRVLSDTLERVFTGTKSIRNPWEQTLDEGKNIIAARDKFGQWLTVIGESSGLSLEAGSSSHTAGNISITTNNTWIDTHLCIQLPGPGVYLLLGRCAGEAVASADSSGIWGGGGILYQWMFGHTSAYPVYNAGGTAAFVQRVNVGSMGQTWDRRESPVCFVLIVTADPPDIATHLSLWVMRTAPTTGFWVNTYIFGTAITHLDWIRLTNNVITGANHGDISGSLHAYPLNNCEP